MKNLVLLRGVPGSGKSTYIKEHNLEPYTLEPDHFRLLVSSPELNIEGNFVISQKVNQQAWGMLYQALELRMQHGAFTVIDATHLTQESIQNYKELVTKYHYRCYYIDFTDISFDELVSRNRQRSPLKQVPQSVLDRFYALSQITTIPSFCKKINSIDDILNYYTFNSNQYDKVIVVGDIHGCYDVFMEAVGNSFSSHNQYIFCGDYLERGIQNAQVFNWILQHIADENIVWLEGNHERHFFNYGNNLDELNRKGKVHNPKDFIQAVNEILTLDRYNGNEQLLKKDMRIFYRKLRDCFAFTRGYQKYLVTHGGLSLVPQLGLISSKDMIYGVGDYDTPIDKIFATNYTKGLTQGFIQIHGHRITSDNQYSICLDSGVEQGGSLSIYEITTTPTKKQFKNTVFKEQPIQERGVSLTQDLTINAMLKSPIIKVKLLPEHNLMSLNFTKKAFRKGLWDNLTVQARGLFVDQYTGQVKLRSYNKFFNLGERPETQISSLQKLCVFPLKAYKKENGFLGIMSVVDDKVVLASKSQITGQYVNYFKEIWETCTLEDRQLMKQVALAYNCSLVFEVCHLDDRHIIDFTENHLYLLDAIPNRLDIKGIHINEHFSEQVKSLLTFASPCLTKKQLVAEFNTMGDLTTFLGDQKYNTQAEGIVLQDRKGYMFKCKFEYYKTVKHLRTTFDYLKKHYEDGVDLGHFKTSQSIKFATFFLQRPFIEWKDLHIIDAVQLYLDFVQDYKF